MPTGVMRIKWVAGSGRGLARRFTLVVALAAGLLGMSASVVSAAVPRQPVVHDSFGWNQDLTRPAFLGALNSLIPPKAIDGVFVLEKLHWSAWARHSARATGEIGWAQPGPGGNGISRSATATVTLYGVATHGSRPYYSRLSFSFSWRGHKYAGTERFLDPCGNTTGCWVRTGG